MAWRNLWRNRRRTFITMASVFFAVFFATLQQSFHLGMWHTLLEGVLHSYTGYLQVHTKDYWNNKNFDYAMQTDSGVTEKILANRHVKGIVPRLESFALASSGERTKIVIVAGIDPEKEYSFTKLPDKIAKGTVLNANDQAAMVSQRLAKFLKLDVGDTLVLLGQGYAGATAAGKFCIRGIVHLPAPEWDNQMVYLSLPTAQSFYSAGHMLTSLVVDLKNTSALDRTTRELTRSLGPSFEVMTWRELLVELYQQYISDVGGGYILLGLLYLVIGFGIFGTLMMMVNERRYEFGIMVSVGMRRYRLALVVAIEIFIIAFLGVLAGMAGSVPAVAWFHFHPIRLSESYAEVMAMYGMDPDIQTLWKAGYILKQGLAIFILSLLALIGPVISVARINPAKALKH